MSESIQRIEHITLQPVEITTSVEISVGAKGELKPTVKASIKRYLNNGDAVFDKIVVDSDVLKNEVEAQIKNIMRKGEGE